MVKDIRFSSLLLPFFTIIGTLVFSAAASLLLTSWNIYDCVAVGSGFAYYSLSSLLIVQLKEASAGIEIASQLGAIALLANIIREMLALFGAPLYASFFGKFAPVSVAGINSMDVCLPVISRYSGKNIVPVAIIHGLSSRSACCCLSLLFASRSRIYPQHPRTQKRMRTLYRPSFLFLYPYFLSRSTYDLIIYVLVLILIQLPPVHPSRITWIDTRTGIV